MEYILDPLDNLQQDEQYYESLTQLSDFWRYEDLKQGLGSTQESDFNVLHDQNIQSHMKWHLRELSELDAAGVRRHNRDDSYSFSQDFGDINGNYGTISSRSGRSSQASQSCNLKRSYSKQSSNPIKYSIMICTDFAFPKFGGVETHGYQLGQCLIERGHKVCFITNKFQGSRCGVRHMANGMKVYHLPHLPVMQGDVAFFSFFNSLPLIRQILIREHIDIVHGHQSTSILQHCVMMAAKSYGLKTVFTEHSLFCYNDTLGIHLNKIIKWSFRDLDAAICVSHACKDNFVLRAKVDPRKTFTIPNAVDSNKFTPDPAIRQGDIAKSGNPNQINIVYISRLQYRKGVDLLIGIIPKILAQFENVHFIIGGDGAGMVHLQELVEKHNLHGRVELLGGLPHDEVRDVLCRGHIFLNTSLTESFCIAILEAACCGLLVVTTDVGGVPEVLPPHMAYLAKPDERSILRQLRKAVVNVKSIPCETFYNKVASIYSWRQVAERTERVYDYVMKRPVPNILARLKSSVSWGPVVGLWAIFYTIIEALTLWITELLFPESEIDIVRNFDSQSYNMAPQKFGNHELYVNTQDIRNKPQDPTIIDAQNNLKQQEKRKNSKKVQQFKIVDHTKRYTIVRPSLEQIAKEEEQIKEQPIQKGLAVVRPTLEKIQKEEDQILQGKYIKYRSKNDYDNEHDDVHDIHHGICIHCASKISIKERIIEISEQTLQNLRYYPEQDVEEQQKQEQIEIPKLITEVPEVDNFAQDPEKARIKSLDEKAKLLEDAIMKSQITDLKLPSRKDSLVDEPSELRGVETPPKQQSYSSLQKDNLLLKELKLLSPESTSTIRTADTADTPGGVNGAEPADTIIMQPNDNDIHKSLDPSRSTGNSQRIQNFFSYDSQMQVE